MVPQTLDYALCKSSVSHNTSWGHYHCGYWCCCLSEPGTAILKDHTSCKIAFKKMLEEKSHSQWERGPDGSPNGE